MESVSLFTQPTAADTQAGSVQSRILQQTLDGAGANTLGKDDFLKLLLVQLTNQDPTQPMQDREFIAQMAQFSSLEQMTNMNTEMGRISGLLQRTQALALVGHEVEVTIGESVTSGVVEAVSGNEIPQILVNGRYYDMADVTSVTGTPRDEITARGAQAPVVRPQANVDR